jgi:hypothetical protein
VRLNDIEIDRLSVRARSHGGVHIVAAYDAQQKIVPIGFYPAEDIACEVAARIIEAGTSLADEKSVDLEAVEKRALRNVLAARKRMAESQKTSEVANAS